MDGLLGVAGIFPIFRSMNCGYDFSPHSLLTKHNVVSHFPPPRAPGPPGPVKSPPHSRHLDIDVISQGQGVGTLLGDLCRPKDGGNQAIFIVATIISNSYSHPQIDGKVNPY